MIISATRLSIARIILNSFASTFPTASPWILCSLLYCISTTVELCFFEGFICTASVKSTIINLATTADFLLFSVRLGTTIESLFQLANLPYYHNRHVPKSPSIDFPYSISGSLGDLVVNWVLIVSKQVRSRKVTSFKTKSKLVFA